MSGSSAIDGVPFPSMTRSRGIFPIQRPHRRDNSCNGTTEGGIGITDNGRTVIDLEVRGSRRHGGMSIRGRPLLPTVRRRYPSMLVHLCLFILQTRDFDLEEMKLGIEKIKLGLR